jgi:hypothetical protein
VISIRCAVLSAVCAARLARAAVPNKVIADGINVTL